MARKLTIIESCKKSVVLNGSESEALHAITSLYAGATESPLPAGAQLGSLGYQIVGNDEVEDREDCATCDGQGSYLIDEIETPFRCHTCGGWGLVKSMSQSTLEQESTVKDTAEV